MTLRSRRLLLLLLLLLLAAFGLLNLCAWHQARTMLHYAPDGSRTPSPEDLSPAAKLRLLLTGVNLPRPADERPPSSLATNARVLSIAVPGGVDLCAWLALRGPEAPLAVFFHGYSTDKTRLLPEARRLHAAGASVLLVDFRGSGGSSETYTTLGWREAEDVAAVARFARKHLPHSALILYGQSMGSAAILRAIHAHAVAPDAVILESVFDTMSNAIRARFRAMGLPPFPAADLLAFWGGQQFDFNACAHAPRVYAGSLTCPALFLHGTDDPRAPVAQARRVFDAAPTRRKTFVTFDHVGHGSYFSRHPDAWQSVVFPLFGSALHPEVP